MKNLAWRAATAAGAVGAVAAAGVAATVVQKRHDEQRQILTTGDEPFGSVRSAPHTVFTADDLALHAEVDEGPAPTVVFVHGWLCDLDTWHYQRLALRNEVRMVFYDHRSHGKSDRSYAANSSLDNMADDLGRVLHDLVPEGPIVLVGHSMGGMTIMRYAANNPEEFGGRIVGVALIATSSGRLMRRSPALAFAVRMARALGRLLDWGRTFNSYSVIRRFAVGPRASVQAIGQAHEMITRSPTSTILDFYENFLDLDLGEGLATVSKVRTVVVCGTRDQITPFSHSKWLAKSIEGSELVTVNDSGHMVMLEEPEQVTEAIERVLKDVT